MTTETPEWARDEAVRLVRSCTPKIDLGETNALVPIIAAALVKAEASGRGAALSELPEVEVVEDRIVCQCDEGGDTGTNPNCACHIRGRRQGHDAALKELESQIVREHLDYAKARAEGIEEAEGVCEEFVHLYHGGPDEAAICDHLIGKIRALKEPK